MDELTLLRSTREIEPPQAALDRGRAALLERAAVAGVAAQAPTRHRRGMLIGLSGTAAALALTGGAAIIALAPQETIDYSVHCFAQASTSSTYTTVGRAIATDVRTGAVGERTKTDPVEDCSAMWRMGLIGQETSPDDPNSADFPVPELVACAMKDGVGAAFPRGDSTATDPDFCAALGLGAWVMP